MFADHWAGYEHYFHIDKDGKPLPLLINPPLSFTQQREHLILVTHNESVFFQNDTRLNYWGHKSTTGTPRPKGEGQSLMVSDFLTTEWGPLRDDQRSVTPTLFLISY